MTTEFDSFDQSAFGAFVQTPFDARNDPQGRVLIWRQNRSSLLVISRLNRIAAIYTELGIENANETNWTGNINDYSLIIWAMAISDAPWMPQVRANTWRGRLFITGEWYPGAASAHLPMINYCNSLSSLHGMSIPSVTFPPSENPFPARIMFGPTKPNPLTAGVASIAYNLSAFVQGGNALASMETVPTGIWIAQNYRNGMDWILSGDAAPPQEEGSANWATRNTKFFENLAKVPLG